jgi:lysophospholipase L1-like esterase
MMHHFIRPHNHRDSRYAKGMPMTSRFLRFYTYMGTFLFSSVIILIVGHYVIGLRIYLLHHDDVHPSARLPAYDNFPEREQFWKDFDQHQVHFEPYTHWAGHPFSTKYINVEPNGRRRTIKHPAAHARKVFMMGGSTMWATGATDETTIPSFLQAALGSTYDVTNYGETAYVSTQELNQLLKALADGDIPDYVIFYDGNNDGYAGAYSPAIPRDPQAVRKQMEGQEQASEHLAAHLLYDLYQHSNYSKIFYELKQRRLALWDKTIEGREPVLAKKVVDYYEANIRQVKALAKEYHFKVYFFWQPNLFNPLRKPVSYENEFLQNASPVFIESQRQIYLEAKRRFDHRQSEGIFFIGDVFNDIEEPVYLDWSHISPDGNRIVANIIFNSIRLDESGNRKL